MALESVHRRIGQQHAAQALALAALSAAIVSTCGLSGCGKTPEITSYTVAKEQTELSPPIQATMPNAAKGDGQAQSVDRMLAAIVPHGENAWTFKLTGPADVVDKHADEFESLVKSISFSGGASGQPKWKLPEGWTDAIVGSAMRYATITIPDESKPLEISVATVPWPANQNAERLLMNVNRWRGQMQMKEIGAAELASVVRSIPLADGTATLVDLKGSFQSSGMPPFAGSGAHGGPGSTTSLPAGHPSVNPSDMPKSKGAPATSSEKSVKGSTPSTLTSVPFTYETPADWKSAPAPQFASAGFVAGEGSEPIDISITPMSGPGRDLLMNINRWRVRQLGLASITAGDLSTVAKDAKVGGKPTKLVHFVGSEDMPAQQAITAALIDNGDATWVIRMKGDPAGIEKQQANFDKFLSSIQFGSSEK